MELPLYELRQGLVFRKYNNRLLFYVPKSMRSNVIRTCHDEVGHVGHDKTFELITRSYWFLDLSKSIKDHIQNCLRCITYSPVIGKKEGELHPIPKGNLPFDTIHIDHYGPLEKTPRKNKFVFEIVDAFSKFVKFYPCRSTSTRESIKNLNTYFNSYSRPNRIISDRGSCFCSDEFKTFLEEQNIRHILIAAGTPRGNAQIERVNRDLTPMLAKLTPEPHKWDSILNEVEYAMNNTFNKSINIAPSVLLFGIYQKGKMNDSLKEYLLTFQNFNRDLDRVRTEAEVKNKLSQEQNKRYFDAKHKTPYKYNVGDYVMVSVIDTTVGINKKLIPKYRGPYVISKVLGNDRYLVEDVSGFQVTQRRYKSVLKPSHLKLWLSPSEDSE